MWIWPYTVPIVSMIETINMWLCNSYPFSINSIFNIEIYFELEPVVPEISMVRHAKTSEL